MTRPASPPRGWFIAPEEQQDADVHFHRRVRDGFQALAAAEPGRFVVVDGGASDASVRSAVRAGVGRLEGSSRPPSEPIRPVVRIKRSSTWTHE